MKIIGFDFDGVFINIEDQKAAIFGQILNHFWGIDPVKACKVWINHLGTSRRYKFDCLYMEKFGEELGDQAYEEVEQHLSDILMRDMYPNANLISETYEVAKNINSNFDMSFISSGVTMAELGYITKKLSIAQYFNKIYGMNSNFRSKYDHFNELLQDRRISLGIFIGDGLEDMRVAKHYNFYAIGLSSNHSPQALLKAGADVICDYSELEDSIRAIISD